MNSNSSSTLDLERGALETRKRLTVTFRGLNVHVTAPDAALGETLLSVADPQQLLSVFRRNEKPKRVCTYDRNKEFEVLC